MLNLFHKNDTVVDVGCGSGTFVNSLRALGFKNVIGIDPYLNKDINSSFGVPLKKQSLDELAGKWDQIWLIHSLEHMPDPAATFQSISGKLADNGTAVVSLPICDSYDYEEYGSDWAGCDAPVHLFLHTKNSMELLYRPAGLQLVGIYCLEGDWPLVLSEKIRHGYAIDNHVKSLEEILGKSCLEAVKAKTEEINSTQQAGMATFVFKHAVV